MSMNTHYRSYLCRLIAVWFFLSLPAQAADLEFPLWETPFNRDGLETWPSMQQSLQLSSSFYRWGHGAIAERVQHRGRRQLAIAAFDVITVWLPPGSAWLHEEWHRAVLSRHGISSHNEVYDLPLLAETIAVNEVRDSALIRLKATSPADMVRLSSAGMEAQNEQNFLLEQKMFRHPDEDHRLLLWLNYLNNSSYLYSCAGGESINITRDITRKESASIAQRDFTGLDCNAWVYDLFRPDESYTARGIHPSGTGIDRYRDWDDLSRRERDYLLRQRNLSLLNLVNPMLYGQRAFGEAGQAWHPSLRHHLTPFGHSLEMNLMLRRHGQDWLMVLRRYANDKHWGPGLMLRVPRQDRKLGGRTFSLSGALNLWRQPRELRFDNRTWRAGSSVRLRLGWQATNRWRLFVESEQKSRGWQAGNVYLDKNLSHRLGTAYFWK